MSRKIKMFLFIGVEVLAVTIIFLLILFAGRKTYTVTFDLNGGELLSGSLVQDVRRGNSANPPSAVREGCYLLKWSSSYNKITGDKTVYAVWEYETNAGIEYEVPKNANYCLISGCYENLSGDIYIGSYYNNLKVLGITNYAFEDCKYIEKIHLLDGVISIGDRAFANCTGLKSITLPKTLERIGYGAFEGCTSLEEIIIGDKVVDIKSNAFYGCSSLKEIIIPKNVKYMGANVFNNLDMTINVMFTPDEVPETWSEHFAGANQNIVYGYEPVAEESPADKEK